MIRKSLYILLIVLATGCATTAAPPEERHPNDPWEPFNRSVFVFNSAVDRSVVRPIARGYDTVTPSPIQRGVRNFFTNLRSPVVVFNLLLQGRGGDAGEELTRFFVNTIYGIGGLFDVASAGDLEKHDEDFGQTMATWGWEESRFVILPFLGPSTVRDGLGRGVDTVPDVAWRIALDEGSYGLIGLDIIQTRAQMLPLDKEIEQAFDPYTFVRDGWMQRRKQQVHDGEQPLPDYDAFLDDGEDW